MSGLRLGPIGFRAGRKPAKSRSLGAVGKLAAESKPRAAFDIPCLNPYMYVESSLCAYGFRAIIVPTLGLRGRVALSVSSPEHRNVCFFGT